MRLNNSGDTIMLLNPAGETVDAKSFGSVQSGELVEF